MKNSRPKFPIGKLQIPTEIETKHIDEAIEVLRFFPEQLKLMIATVEDELLDQSYREGSWTLRQLVHHIADSHNHAYNRIRWALTEESPVIKAYDQDAFAAMEDNTTAPIAWSLKHIEVLHHKFNVIFSSLTEAQWNRYFIHPETENQVTIKEMALTYAWHSMHHFMHLKNAL